MDSRILVVGFGEPPSPDPEAVKTYLERIFLENMPIEGEMPAEAAKARASELADRRLPGLIAEYEEIGGSPLGEHLKGHAERLRMELDARGITADIEVATQFFEPTIEEVVNAAGEDQIEQLIVLPMYPLCGPSTTVASIATVADAIEAFDGWHPTLIPIGGWHRHPRYNRLRANHLASTVSERGIDLADPEVALIFSAHGTPIHYLDEGSRYDQYVEEYCEVQARLLDIDSYSLGYQNHEARGVEWTEPSIEEVIETIDARHVVVEPVSFIHEQSETLSELDIELAEEASAVGLEFDRVPVPHDDPAMAGVFADLVEPALVGFDDGYYGFRGCQCASTPGTRCLCAPFN